MNGAKGVGTAGQAIPGETGENTFSGWSSGQRSVNWPTRRLKGLRVAMRAHDDASELQNAFSAR